MKFSSVAKSILIAGTFGLISNCGGSNELDTFQKRFEKKIETSEKYDESADATKAHAIVRDEAEIKGYDIVKSEPINFCPSGFAYDSKNGNCASDTDVVGPFPEGSKKICLTKGNQFCQEAQWPVEFANSIKLGNRCFPGAKFDLEIGYCVEDQNIFGPFTKQANIACLAAKGGSACSSNRWSIAFFSSQDFEFLRNLQSFTLLPPTTKETKRQVSLWATAYYVPSYVHDPKGFAVLSLSGKSLDYSLPYRNWCLAAIEGSVLIKKSNGVKATFNYAGSGSNIQLDCLPVYKSIQVGKSRWRKSNGEFGDGVKSFKLVPYRTIAVDPTFIPYGSLVYIPKARGLKFFDETSEKSLTHDGYFYAADTGGAIKGQHIDVFQGLETSVVFPFVKSTSRGTFDAMIISAGQLTDAFEEAHLK